MAEPTPEEVAHYVTQLDIFHNRANAEREADGEEPYTRKEATDMFNNLLKGMIERPVDTALYFARSEAEKLIERITRIELKLGLEPLE